MSRILRHVGANDLKRTRQRQISEEKERAAQKLKEWQEAEAERKQIEEAARPYKSNWRRENLREFGEWAPIETSGPTNSTSTTFGYFAGGSPVINGETGQQVTFTYSGLDGVENYPTTATINQGFGDISSVDAPNYSQLGLQGYAPPLGGVQRKTQQTENERIDAEIRKLEEQIKQLDQKRSDLENKQVETEPQYTGMTPEEFADRDNEIGEKWADKMWPLQKKLNDNPVCIAADKCVGTKEALMRMSEQMIKEHEDLHNQYMSQVKAHQKAFDAHFSAYEKKFDSIRKEKEALYAKIAELEKQRPINQQLDASQQAYPNLPMMNARVSPAAGTLENSLFWDIEEYDKLTLPQKQAVLKAYERNLKNSTPPPALRDYRNTSPISPAMRANIGTATRIMFDYATKGWDNRVVADNEYLGRDYIDKQFFPNVTFFPYGENKTNVGGGDAVVGNGQPPRVDPETGEIVVRANFDIMRNDHEAFGATGEEGKRKQEYAKRLERLKYASDTMLRMPDMFDYTLDSVMDFLPGPLKIPAALLVSPIVAGSKSIGRGNNIPIVIRFTPQELKRKNKKEYDKLVEMGLIKESTFDKIKKHR